MSIRSTTRAHHVWVMLCVLAAMLASSVGCKSDGQPMIPLPGTPPQPKLGMPPDDVRNQLQAFADTLVARTSQVCDALQKPDEPLNIRVWAQAYKVGTMGTAYIYATGENPAVSLLDMVVYVTLKRTALENHFIPTLLQDKGKPVLQVYQESERDIWALAAKVITPEQIDQLHDLIDQWQKDHPNDYYVALVRFGDFSTTYAKDMTSDKGGAAPGNIFSLLYLDPLSNLDTATQQVKSIELLTERIMFLAGRYSFLINAQVQLAILQAGESPAAIQALAATSQISDAAEQMANTFQGYQNFISQERKRAVDQVMDGVTAQREALMKDINDQAGTVASVLKDTRSTIETTRTAALAITDGATKTVEVAEGSSQRLVKYVFQLSVALVVITVLCITAAMLAYNRLKVRQHA